VYEASRLPNADQGRTLYSNDKSDPYVVVTVTPTRGRAMTKRTHYVTDALDPKWFATPGGQPATAAEAAAGAAALGVRLRFAPVTSTAATLHVLVKDRNTVRQIRPRPYLSIYTHGWVYLYTRP
jgi:hypothetical protein